MTFADPIGYTLVKLAQLATLDQSDMSTDGANDFAKLFSDLRNGDESAASELVQNYEAELRRYIRFRLTDPSLRRVVDSLDICQSVFGRFFVRVSEGELDLATPQQLRALLITMARNRLYDEVRHEHAVRRDARRIHAGDTQLQGLDDGSDSPSKIVALNEVMSAIRSNLSPEEQYLIDQKLSGRQWADLANELGGTSDSLRKRMERALDRTAKALGFVET